MIVIDIVMVISILLLGAKLLITYNKKENQSLTEDRKINNSVELKFTDTVILLSYIIGVGCVSILVANAVIGFILVVGSVILMISFLMIFMRISIKKTKISFKQNRKN